MKNNHKKFVCIFGVLLCLAITSCKVNDRIPPLASQNASTASIPVLKTYLSKTLAVSESEISYNAGSHEFTIRKGIIMKEIDVQSHYRAANEYKLRNGISN
jgi:hypothetical protein